MKKSGDNKKESSGKNSKARSNKKSSCKRESINKPRVYGADIPHTIYA